MDKTNIAVAVFNKCANEYQDKFMDVDLYSDTFDVFCGHITKENAFVLEIACGPGNITKYLLKKRPDFKISGIDLSPNMIELAKLNNPEADFHLMDCRNIGSLGGKYDGIMCGFCLPYLSKEESIKLISDASGLLTSDGVLYLSTMEGDNSKSGFERSSLGDQIYVNYHQADYLVDTLRENSFKIIDIQHRRYPVKNRAEMTDLLIIAGK